MANTTATQPEAGETPKPAETDDKTTQPEASEKPKKEGDGKPRDGGTKDGGPKESQADDKYAGIKKTGKIVVYAALAVAAGMLIQYYFFTPQMVAVSQVKQQDYTGELHGTGTINVAVLAAVGAKIPGRIERMLVEEGDFVHAGQVVATLEDTDLRQMVQRSQARLEAAGMTEQAARASEQSARANELSTRATEQERRATEYQASRAWEREKHLVATGAVSQEEADQYQERGRTAASAVGAAQAEIGAAHAQVEAAGAKVGAMHSEIAAAGADVRLQQFNLSQTKIFTYVSGIVTDRPRRSGDSIVSGETVISVADPKLILVEAYLDQRFAGDIRAGQTATVALRGRAKEQLPGRVYRVRPQADPAAEEMTVEISFPWPPSELQIGHWADVYVATSQTKNALVVPKTAVMTMGDERSVFVVDADNKARQVKVESIASSPRSGLIAISGDLRMGEWVLTEPMGIKPGQKVRQDRSSRPKITGPQMGTSPVMKM
jgi:RND family efflux transporter MFP subunit